jgi:hypothetical protein
MVLVQQEIPFRHGYDIGIGVDMATGSPMAKGAQGEVTPPQIGSGGSEDFTFRRIETTNDLESELGVSADVSAGIGLFSASASFDFTKRCKVQTSSLTILISCRKTFSFQQMDIPALTGPASDRVANNQVEQFAEQFGNYFVRGIGTGGRFFGVVRIDTKNVQSKMDLDAAFSGSYGLTLDADAKVHISEAVASANAKAEAFILIEGGSIQTHPKGNDPLALVNDMFKAMDEWAQTVKGDPEAYTVTLAPYAIALGPKPPNLADLEKQRGVLVRCAKLRSLTLDKLNLVDYILDPRHSAEFDITPPPEGPDLPALQAALAGDLDVIGEAASFAIDNVKQAVEPETYMRTVRSVPDFTLTSLPAAMPKQHPGVVAPVAAAGPGWSLRPTSGLPSFRAVTSVRGNPHPPTMLALLIADDGTLWKSDDGAGGIIVQQAAPGKMASLAGPSQVGVDANGLIWSTLATTPTQPQNQVPPNVTGGSPVVFAMWGPGLFAVTADGRAWVEVSLITKTTRWDPFPVPVPVRKLYRSWNTGTTWALPTASGAGVLWSDKDGWHHSQPFSCVDIALDVAGSTLWILDQDGSVWTTRGSVDERLRMSGGDFAAIAGGFQAHTAMALKRDGTVWDLHTTP